MKAQKLMKVQNVVNGWASCLTIVFCGFKKVGDETLKSTCVTIELLVKVVLREVEGSTNHMFL